jgi:lysozyme
MRYYNDAPVNGNCTWGIGTLAHLGPCTPEELARTVLPDQANAILQSRVREAERNVRSIVKRHELTQAQFDAAVSFAYNSSTLNTQQALSPANNGNMLAVAQKMMLNIMITPRNAAGRPAGSARISRGLLNRRQRESAPFRQGTQ